MPNRLIVDNAEQHKRYTKPSIRFIIQRKLIKYKAIFWGKCKNIEFAQNKAKTNGNTRWTEK